VGGGQGRIGDLARRGVRGRRGVLGCAIDWAVGGGGESEWRGGGASVCGSLVVPSGSCGRRMGLVGWGIWARALSAHNRIGCGPTV
jgi:hypothetical protein